jgi:hypothetical protein
MPPSAVPIVPVGPVAAATLIFRENGLVNVAAIVKASFAFEHHGPMSPAQPEPLFTREVHRMNNPTRSISATSDLTPRLPGVDVLLLAQAHAPGGSATQMSVRLAVGRGGTAVLDKTVLVVGDRKGNEIKPFRSMPLVYEKAFGGPGHRDNPLGTGALAGDAPPNLVDPRAAPGTLCGFAPISRVWPARASMISAADRSGLDRPIMEIPPGFDFRYFHAAPPDQRIGHLIGDEWILLENVHPSQATLHLQLPGAQAMVRVIGADGAPRVFSLRADTLRIDPEAERVTIVWRNSFRVEEAELELLRLFAGVALPGATVVWPEIAPARPAAPLPAAAARTEYTLILDDRTAAFPGSASGHSFGTTMEVSDEDLEPVHEEPAPPDFSSTAILSSTAVPPTAPLPVFMQAQAAAPPPAHARPKLSADPKEGTLDLSRELAAVSRAVMPFAGGPPKPSEPRPSAPIPGSPWDPGRPHALPAEDAPTYELGSADLSSTLTSSSPSTPAYRPAEPPGPLEQAPSPPPPALVSPPPPPVQAVSPAPPPYAAPAPPPAPTPVAAPPPPAPPVPAAPPRQAAAATEDPWGRDLRTGQSPPRDEPPAPAPAAPAAKPAAPPKGLKDALYKRFKKG